MTPEHHHAHAAIRQRLAAATQAGDARKADAYAACFAEGGVLALDRGAIEGREAIRAWMTAPSVIPAPAAVPAAASAAPAAPAYVSHHLTTCSVELLSGAEAKARTYWLVVTAVGLDHSGYYDDRLVAVDDDWLLAHRRPRTLWKAPGSLVA